MFKSDFVIKNFMIIIIEKIFILKEIIILVVFLEVLGIRIIRIKFDEEDLEL